MLHDDILYLKVRQIERALDARLRQELSGGFGVRGVILDLRQSVGGTLDDSVALADLFSREGCLAVARQNGRTDQRDASMDPGDVEAPVVVLIDRLTAGGSELVAAALRLRGRAVLAGERTLGYGILRGVWPLQSGANIIIPAGELFTADGVPLNGHPIEPDFVISASFHTKQARDPAIAFATQLLSQTNGPGRAALLEAAASVSQPRPNSDPRKR